MFVYLHLKTLTATTHHLQFSMVLLFVSWSVVFVLRVAWLNRQQSKRFVDAQKMKHEIQTLFLSLEGEIKCIEYKQRRAKLMHSSI